MKNDSENSFWCYGDVHNYVNDARAWLNVAKPRKVIWLGDFTDNWGDTPQHMRETGHFMKEIIETRPQDVLLLSNHDMTYRFPQKYADSGWGFTHDKCRAFHETFPRSYWKRLGVFHVENYRGQTIVFSHAGFTRSFLPNGIFDEAFLRRVEDMTLKRGDSPEGNTWLDSSFGPMWVRWQLPIIDGICQVVGHTPCDTPQIVKPRDQTYWNLNLDCAKNYVAHFTENGIYYVHKTKDLRLPAKFLDNTIRT